MAKVSTPDFISSVSTAGLNKQLLLYSSVCPVNEARELHGDTISEVHIHVRMCVCVQSLTAIHVLSLHGLEHLKSPNYRPLTYRGAGYRYLVCLKVKKSLKRWLVLSHILVPSTKALARPQINAP